MKQNNFPKLVLVGTSHHFQLPQNVAAAQLKELLGKLCELYDVRLLAEEMSEEALRKSKATHSVGFEVANSLALQHSYCDPDYEERDRIGVLDEGIVRLKAISSGWSDTKLNHKIRLHNHELRERNWLSKLKVHGLWPCLFVCGANHVVPFKELAERDGFSVIVSCVDWEPILTGG